MSLICFPLRVFLTHLKLVMTTTGDPTAGVLEAFRTQISSSVYETVDLATRVPFRLNEELQRVNELIAQTAAEIEELKAELSSGRPSILVSDLPKAELTSEQKTKADTLARCLNMTARMTACTCTNQADGSIRLMCGGMLLRPGDTFEGLQANWDLIDTATGADS